MVASRSRLAAALAVPPAQAAGGQSAGGLLLHQYAMKMPQPKKTGNSLIDNDNGEKISMLKELVSVCLNDLDHVQPLYCKLRERQRLVAVCSAMTDTEFSHVKTVSGLPPAFVTHFIASNSDLDIAAVNLVYKTNQEDLWLLLCFLCQLPGNFKWPEKLHSREVTFRFLNIRVAQAGNRMAQFKAEGGAHATTNKVNWKKVLFV